MKNDRRREPFVEAGPSDGSHHPREPAAVVRVPVREAHRFDGRKPDAEPTRVLKPDLGGRSDVEEDRPFFRAAPPPDQRREAVAGVGALGDSGRCRWGRSFGWGVRRGAGRGGVSRGMGRRASCRLRQSLRSCSRRRWCVSGGTGWSVG